MAKAVLDEMEGRWGWVYSGETKDFDGRRINALLGDSRKPNIYTK